MAADVCLLLMQALTGECDAAVPRMSSPIAPLEQSKRQPPPVDNSAPVAIAPMESAVTPQFGTPPPCQGEQADRLLVCLDMASQGKPAPAPRSMSVPSPVPPEPSQMATGQEGIPPRPMDSAPSAPKPTAVTTPVALQIPPAPVPIPPPQSPQFSAPSSTAPLRPTSGAQLYRQRQLALQSGQIYTRLSPQTFAAEWQGATGHPTYQDWVGLLDQEARAVAYGQGQNRLDIVVGDSLGLWLPPETLPRDRLWLNQSISGDTTAGILQRLGAFADTRPTTIHLLAGANDLKNGVPEATIVQNLRLTVERLQQHHPGAEIVVYSVFPTRRAEITNDRVRSLNQQLAVMARHQAVTFRDVHPLFQDQWGHLRYDLTTDGLHLNARGYALWQQAMVAISGG